VDLYGQGGNVWHDRMETRTSCAHRQAFASLTTRVSPCCALLVIESLQRASVYTPAALACLMQLLPTGQKMDDSSDRSHRRRVPSSWQWPSSRGSPLPTRNPRSQGSALRSSRLYRAPQASIRSAEPNAVSSMSNSNSSNNSSNNNNNNNNSSCSELHHHASPPYSRQCASACGDEVGNNANANIAGPARRRRGPPSSAHAAIKLERQESDHSLGMEHPLQPASQQSQLSVLKSHLFLPEIPALWQSSDFSRTNSNKRNQSTPVVSLDDSVERELGGSFPDGLVWKQSHKSKAVSNGGVAPSPRNRRSASLHLRLGYDDYGDANDDDSSFAGGVNNTQHHPMTSVSQRDRKQGYRIKSLLLSWGGQSQSRWGASTWWTPLNVIQIFVLCMLAFLIFQSNHRVSLHQQQLKQYDEERAHILEQMMWIDKAAKKVHQRYSQPFPVSGMSVGSPTTATSLSQDGENNRSDVDGGSDTINTDTAAAVDSGKDESQHTVESAQSTLEQIQLRIQLNARDLIREKFGDRPIIVTLPLTSSQTPLVLALSDDTPHAAATLMKQIEKHWWDNVRMTQHASGSIQITTSADNTSPLLEFMERSRGCHDVDSVALRQEPDDRERHKLTLYINQVDKHRMEANDVCIGKVVGGMEDLLASFA
jgi:hypothetical protein